MWSKRFIQRWKLKVFASADGKTSHSPGASRGVSDTPYPFAWLRRVVDFEDDAFGSAAFFVGHRRIMACVSSFLQDICLWFKDASVCGRRAGKVERMAERSA
jgi:hypothetical protein